MHTLVVGIRYEIKLHKILAFYAVLGSCIEILSCGALIDAVHSCWGDLDDYLGTLEAFLLFV
jgi:hypothetical protein